jgi:hypothetical protein
MQNLVHVDVVLHRLHISLHMALLLLYRYLPIPSIGPVHRTDNRAVRYSAIE